MRRERRDVVQLGSECVGFDEDADGVTARFADGREERGAMLIGADGLHSTIRKQLHGDTELRYSGLHRLAGDARRSRTTA